MRTAGALLACMLIVTLLYSSGQGDGAGTAIPTNSTWEYSYNETVVVPGIAELDIRGVWRYTCMGLDTLNFSGTGTDVLIYYSEIDATVTGSMYVWGGFDSHWISVTGGFTSSGFEYLDSRSRTPVRTELDQKLEIPNPWNMEDLLYYEEHNDTVYSSVSVIPTEYNLKLEEGSISPGAKWTIIYNGSISVSGLSNNDYFSQSYDVHAHVNQTYVADENVSVPAGNFSCRKVLSDYADADVTEWYSPEAKGNAKVSISSENDLVVSSLVAYELHEEAAPTEPVDHGMIILLATTATVAVSVGGTLAFHLWRRKRPPAPEGAPVPTEEQRVG